MVKLARKTKETHIELRLGIARGADPTIAVSVVALPAADGAEPERLRFFEHMLTALARYAGLDLHVEARGDLRHHVMEDVALAIGAALADARPATAARFGERTVPMDDALVQAVIDVGGRPYFAGKLPSRLYTHVLRSLATELGATLHVRVLRGVDRHHVIEAAFKATGLALRQALAEGGAVFSTKGSVAWEREP
jgi:imidazoleglycerol-phosphate dehydratase